MTEDERGRSRNCRP